MVHGFLAEVVLDTVKPMNGLPADTPRVAYYNLAEDAVLQLIEPEQPAPAELA
jgi:hypothetical protein